jgi:hypothetical protein
MPRQVGDLHFPVPRVDDRPGRQQQDGRLAVAEHLVVSLDPVALDVAVTTRLACPHRGPPFLELSDQHADRAPRLCPVALPGGTMIALADGEGMTSMTGKRHSPSVLRL